MCGRFIKAFALFFAGSIYGITYITSIDAGHEKMFVLTHYILIATFLGWLFSEFHKYYQIWNSTIFKELEKYAKEKYPIAKLCIFDDENYYQGSAGGYRWITLSERWYTHLLENPQHIEYVKCVICHEIYHLKQLHPPISSGLKKAIMDFCPSKTAKDTYLISLWLEELHADRYGCQLYGNKDLFLEKMYFLKENGYLHKKMKKSDHPSWDLRIKYITEDIEPTEERVKQDFLDYYKNI